MAVIDFIGGPRLGSESLEIVRLTVAQSTQLGFAIVERRDRWLELAGLSQADRAYWEAEAAKADEAYRALTTFAPVSWRVGKCEACGAPPENWRDR